MTDPTPNEALDLMLTKIADHHGSENLDVVRRAYALCEDVEPGRRARCRAAAASLAGVVAKPEFAELLFQRLSTVVGNFTGVRPHASHGDSASSAFSAEGEGQGLVTPSPRGASGGSGARSTDLELDSNSAFPPPSPVPECKKEKKRKLRNMRLRRL